MPRVAGKIQHKKKRENVPMSRESMSSSIAQKAEVNVRSRRLPHRKTTTHGVRFTIDACALFLVSERRTSTGRRRSGDLRRIYVQGDCRKRGEMSLLQVPHAAKIVTRTNLERKQQYPVFWRIGKNLRILSHFDSKSSK